MHSKIFLFALTSALAGFLFGFDTVVISGAEKKIQNLWLLSDSTHGLAVGMALWGTVLGSLVGGWPSDKFGRKMTLIMIGALYLISAIWSALANDVNSFMIARFIGGLGVGISTIAAPLYISEISPADQRGRLTGMFQFNIVFGILVALLSNYLIGLSGNENGWRWMLGVEAVPAIIYCVMCFGIPKSPRWLIANKNDRNAAEEVLRLINPEATDDAIKGLATSIEASAKTDATQIQDASNQRFWTSRLRVPILLAILVAFFNQLSGINAILYFAPRIFQLAGLGESAALLNSVGIGVTNLLFTFVGLYLIDRAGRRSLLVIGSFGYIASLGICAFVFSNYAPQFQVANTAISLQSAVSQLEKTEGLAHATPEDVLLAQQKLSDAKQSFVKSTGADAYQGDPVSLRSNLSNAELTAAATTSLKEAGEKSGQGGTWVMLCIFAFIAAHAIGQGAVIWVLISEIFPSQFRAKGQALGCFTHWIFAAGLTTVFPWVIGTFAPATVFGFFCFMMVLQLIWVVAMVPETKGVPLEEMNRKLGIVD